MASELEPCGMCGRAVRFDGGQPTPENVICESYECHAEAARRARVNAPKAVAEDKTGKGTKKDKAKK